MNDLLVRNLVCPACRRPLDWSADAVACAACSRIYPVSDGIPIMLTEAEAASHALQQAAFYDATDDAEWEITRPRGAPRLYRWFLEEKFRRSVRGLEELLPGATVLTVCGGSGMEADFLARAGATVISSDISLGAARRARARAERYGLRIIPLVAAAERLPFPDQTIDIAYVHDGLHHTAEPMIGLGEMVRVARRAVSITEPAQAFLTSIAMRLGLSPNYAAAGNRIARLKPVDVQQALSSLQFSVHTADRYVMYYKWRPGRYMRLLSRPGLFTLATAGVLLANQLAGQLGNKFVVTAIRANNEQDLGRSRDPDRADRRAGPVARP